MDFETAAQSVTDSVAIFKHQYQSVAVDYLARVKNSSSDIGDGVVGKRDLAVIRPISLNRRRSQRRGWVI